MTETPVTAVGAGDAGPATPTPSIDPTTLAPPSAEDRKNMIGEALYNKISATRHARLAPKITGMLLDGVEQSELVRMLKDPWTREFSSGGTSSAAGPAKIPTHALTLVYDQCRTPPPSSVPVARPLIPLSIALL